MDIRLIALDLDGTLLDSKTKLISPENTYALEKAAEKGINIVPATGRFFDAMPECVKSLPFLRYAITINGARVIDVKTGETIYGAEMPLERGLEVLEYFSSIDVAYDAYIEDKGYMGKDHIDRIEYYLDTPVYCETVRRMRIPVDDLIAYVKSRTLGLQKTQMFTNDREKLVRARDQIKTLFPDLTATSSLKNNLEVNAKEATKGQALAALAGHLGLDSSQVMAFGDGGNDFDMISFAGIGVAMANGVPELKKSAAFTTLSCDGSGVAYAVRRLLL